MNNYSENARVNSAVTGVLGRYPDEPASLIGVLQDVQEELHYLPRVALEQIAHGLSVPRNQVYHVATFFKAFSLTPRGRHTIHICCGTACHLKGAGMIAEAIQSTLKTGDGETTEDGSFTVQTVRCLGCCSLAPAIMIDREVYGEVVPRALRRILGKYWEAESA
ncbi:MAG: NAD(P)H-dependent oxidoreductase subunit E [Candidatus Hydrogenedentes bacterium]|nr:NAD(P)H-dependent oxidoreductase subunit E [Candidatus Hydrogenedentota bacterium]